MSLLQSYFWRQVFSPLMLSLGVLAVLALLTQSLSTLDLIVENRQSALTFLYITVLALPQIFAIILPLTIFFATLFALNRLNVDSEISVIRSAGITPWQISTPIIRLAVAAMIVHLIINLIVQPLSFREMRQEILQVRMDIASQLVRPGEFISPTPGLTIYARIIQPNGHMEDVFIRDARQVDNVLTYTSHQGQISRMDGRARLVLTQGLLQQLDDDGSLQPVSFEKYQIDLSDTMILDQVLRLKTSDRFLHELLRPGPNDYANMNFKRELLAEGHARLATPIYNISLVMLALAFLVRGQYRKLGYYRHIFFCVAIGFMVRLVGFVLQSAAESDSSYNMWQYLFPIIVAIMSGWYLLKSSRSGTLKRWVDQRFFASNSLPIST